MNEWLVLGNGLGQVLQWAFPARDTCIMVAAMAA